MINGSEGSTGDRTALVDKGWPLMNDNAGDDGGDGAGEDVMEVVMNVSHNPACIEQEVNLVTAGKI